MALTKWIKTPFTVGGHLKDNWSGELTAQRQDGSMSALLTFLLLIGFGATLSTGHYITMTSTKPLGNQAVEICLIIYMLLGMVIMTLCMTFARSCTVKVISLMQNTEGTLRKLLKTKLVLIGLIVFYTLGFLVDFLKAMAAVECFSAYKICGFFAEILCTICFHCMQLAFMGMVVVFAWKFHQKTFIKRPLNYYAIMIPAAGLLSIWLNSVLFEVSHIFHELDTPDNATFASCLDQGLSDYVLQCLHQNTSFYKKEAMFTQFLYSFHIEFALLATKVFCDLYFGMESKDSPDTYHMLPLNEENHSDSDGLVEVEPREIQENTWDTSTSLRNFEEQDYDCENNPDSNGPTEISSQPFQIHFDNYVTEEPVVSSSERRISISIVIGFVINILLLTFSLLTYFGWLMSYPVVNIVFFVTMTTSCILGFWSSKNFISDFKPYRGLEILVFVTTIGIFIYDFFGLLAVLAAFTDSKDIYDKLLEYPDIDPKTTTLACLVLFDKLTNILEAFVQTAFMLYMRRIKPRGRDSHIVSCRRIYAGCLNILAISNLVMWLNDTFVKAKNPLAELLELVYFGPNNWALIIFMCFPFALFYRFNSFLLFTQNALMLEE